MRSLIVFFPYIILLTGSASLYNGAVQQLSRALRTSVVFGFVLELLGYSHIGSQTKKFNNIYSVLYVTT